MTQFDRATDRALWQLGAEVFVDLAGMQAFGDIAGEAQLGAGGGDIQQLSAQRRAEFFPGDFRVIGWLCLMLAR